MPYVLIRQRFTDDARWRGNFDSLAERRHALGIESVLVARERDDPSQAVVVFRYDDDARLREHLASADLAQAHRDGGVVEGSTQATFLDDAEPIHGASPRRDG